MISRHCFQQLFMIIFQTFQKMRLLILLLLTISSIYCALDTAAVIAIQTEINKHSADIEMILDVSYMFSISLFFQRYPLFQHVKNLNARVSDLGRPGPPGTNGSPGFPGSKGEKGDRSEDGKCSVAGLCSYHLMRIGLLIWHI